MFGLVFYTQKDVFCAKSDSLYWIGNIMIDLHTCFSFYSVIGHMLVTMTMAMMVQTPRGQEASTTTWDR